MQAPHLLPEASGCSAQLPEASGCGFGCGGNLPTQSIMRKAIRRPERLPEASATIDSQISDLHCARRRLRRTLLAGVGGTQRARSDNRLPNLPMPLA